MDSYRYLLRHKRGLILLLGAATALLTGAATLFMPLSYRATLRLLITQRAAFTLDPYTAIRSTELIGDNLAQIIKTSTFFEKTLKAGYNIDASYYPTDETKRRRKWENTAEASMVRGTGILSVDVYHPDRDQAVQTASALAFLLAREGGDYVGRDIQIRLVDAPLTSRFPVRPNILGTMAGGFLGGVLLSTAVIVNGHRRRKLGP